MHECVRLPLPTRRLEHEVSRLPLPAGTDSHSAYSWHVYPVIAETWLISYHNRLKFQTSIIFLMRTVITRCLDLNFGAIAIGRTIYNEPQCWGTRAPAGGRQIVPRNARAQSLHSIGVDEGLVRLQNWFRIAFAGRGWPCRRLYRLHECWTRLERVRICGGRAWSTPRPAAPMAPACTHSRMQFRPTRRVVCDR